MVKVTPSKTARTTHFQSTEESLSLKGQKSEPILE